MRCPRCRRELPEGASLCRGCGLLLDEALNDEAGGGSGFTSPGASIHAMSPAAPTRPSTSGAAQRPGRAAGRTARSSESSSPRPVSGFQDVPATQETVKRTSLPPEFDDDDDAAGTDDGDGATLVDGGRDFTPSQLHRLQKPDTSARSAGLDEHGEEIEATQLSSVPDAVLRHLRSAESTSEPDGEGLVFEKPKADAAAETQATALWERPNFTLEPDAPHSSVGPEDATMVRPSPYSNVPSTPSSSSEHARKR